MNSVDPKDLKKELAELRKDFEKFKGQYHIDGTGRVSLSNKVLTVDRTVALSDILNRISNAEARLNAMQDLSATASPTFGGLIIPALSTGFVKAVSGLVIPWPSILNTDFGVLGTLNYLAKFGETGLSNSLIFDNGTSVGIGTTSPKSPLHVVGLPSYATNAAAIAAGLTAGAFYILTGTGSLMVVV